MASKYMDAAAAAIETSGGIVSRDDNSYVYKALNEWTVGIRKDVPAYVAHIASPMPTVLITAIDLPAAVPVIVIADGDDFSVFYMRSLHARREALGAIYRAANEMFEVPATP